MSEFTQLIITALIPAIIISVVTALVAYFTIKRSMKQFYSQRWWEKKAEAYSQILETLSDLEYYFYESGSGMKKIKVLSSEDKERLAESERKILKFMFKFEAIGTYAISNDAYNVLKKLINELGKREKKDYCNKGFILVRNCIEEIANCAKKDLKIK